LAVEIGSYQNRSPLLYKNFYKLAIIQLMEKNFVFKFNGAGKILFLKGNPRIMHRKKQKHSPQKHIHSPSRPIKITFRPK